jgi:sialate O-acetylesterase
MESADKDANGKWHIKFRATGILKTRDGAAPRQFAVAGADHQFIDADATIQGNEVVLSCEKMPQPEAVRYAWINDPVGLNLTDDSDLPAVPFRTDNWPPAPK